MFGTELAGSLFDVLEFDNSHGLHTLDVSGWLVARQSVVQSLLFSIEAPVARFNLDLARQDVVDAHPGQAMPLHCGFSGKISTVGFGKSFRIEVQAILAENDPSGSARCPVGFIYGEQEQYFPQVSTQPELNPILVTSNGRTGTTYMMRLLSQHPEIVAPQAYPLEVRHASYCVKTAKTLTERCLDVGGVNRERLRDLDRGATPVGPNPFTHPDLIDQTASEKVMLAANHRLRRIHAAAAVEAIDAFYSAVAGEQNKLSARYFAEKTLPSFIPDAIHELYGRGAKEIILVRDPRDAHASAAAFNRQRKIKDFGEETARSDDEWIAIRQSLFANVMASWRRRRDRAHFLRYEDLVLRPKDTLKALFAYLGLEASDEGIAEMLVRANQDLGAFKTHRTSNSSLDSIGRWRRDLTPDHATLASSLMRADLMEAGYPLD